MLETLHSQIENFMKRFIMAAHVEFTGIRFQRFEFM